MKIVVYRDDCISAGTCVAAAPEVFQLDRRGKVELINPAGADEQTIIAAAKSCPVRAIEVFDDQGKKIAP